MLIYFDHASTSRPKPPEVMQEISSFLETIGASPGRGGYFLAEAAETVVAEVRGKLAAMLQAEHADQIAFTHNGTHAINIVLKGLLQKGDHVIISNFEHNAALRPLHSLFMQRGITYSVWSANGEGFFDLQALKQSVQENTKLLVLNHASNVLGVLSPVKEVGAIAQSRKIPLLIDVAQTAGMFPVDFAACADYIAGTCHKSLLGPSGVGFLYVKDPDTLSPLYEGGSGQHSLSLFHPEISPDKFESGTLNYMGIAGLKGGLSYLETHGQHSIRKKAMGLTQEAIRMLQELPEVTLYGTQSIEHKVPLLSFNLRGFFASEVGYLLNAQGICVRSGLHCAPLMHKSLGTLPQGTVRLSFGHQNTMEEVNQLVAALKKITGKL